jgi:hypothetical protein
MDIIKIDVPTFLRLLELAREDVKDDMSLHFVTEKAIELSKSGVITMDDYDDIIAHMKSGKKNSELDDIKRLGGIK